MWRFLLLAGIFAAYALVFLLPACKRQDTPAPPAVQAPVAAPPAPPAPAVKTISRYSVVFPRDSDGRVLPGRPPAIERSTQALTPPPALAAFDAWLDTYRAAAPAQRTTLADQGRALLNARRAALASLITTDPEAALALSLTPADRAALPADFAAQLEQIVAGSGFYGVKAICHHDEFSPHGNGCRIEPEAVLNGQIYPASIYGSRKERLTEENASLYGIALAGRLALAADDFVLAPAESHTADPACAGQIAVTYKGQTSFVATQADLPAHLQALLAQ